MKNQANLPMLRFPEFVGAWDTYKIGEVFRMIQRPVQKPNYLYKSIGIRSHFKGTFQRIDSDPLKNDMDTLYQVKENDLIVNITFAWEGAVAIANKDDESGYVSHRFPTYENDKTIINIEFFRFIYPTSKFKYELEKISPGGAGRNRVLKKEEFLKIDFCFPTILEQTKIAIFLNTVNDKLKLLNSKKNFLERYKTGVIRQLFTQEIRFKDEFGNEYPDWDEKLLEDIADVKGGKRIPKGFSLEATKNGYPYITVTDMENGSVSMEKIQYVPFAVVKLIKNYTISTNDIYVSVAGTLGLVGTIPQELENANLTENANKITNIKCNQTYLLHYLKSDYFKKLIESVKTIGAQPKLAIYAINGFVVPLPSVPEQQKIASFLSALDDKIAQTALQIEKMQLWKKGLLQQMFC